MFCKNYATHLLSSFRFSPAILLFLISIIPSIWILELHHQENKANDPQVLFHTHSFSGILTCFPPIRFKLMTFFMWKYVYCFCLFFSKPLTCVLTKTLFYSHSYSDSFLCEDKMMTGKFCHHLLTLMSFQTRMTCFLQLNTKEDIFEEC